MKIVCENIEFDSFPYTDSLTDTEQQSIIQFTEKLGCKTRPKVMHNEDYSYAAGVFQLDSRMIAYDHCTLRGGTEYLRIKGKDLTYATHPKYPD